MVRIIIKMRGRNRPYVWSNLERKLNALKEANREGGIAATSHSCEPGKFSYMAEEV